MKSYLSMEGALKRFGSKKSIAEACGVSPSIVAKAFNDERDLGMSPRVRIVDGDWQLVYPRDPWRVVRAISRQSAPSKRTRNY